LSNTKANEPEKKSQSILGILSENLQIFNQTNKSALKRDTRIKLSTKTFIQTMSQVTEQEFFGGAIKGVVPRGWIDSRSV
jgi:hypothetical protein